MTTHKEALTLALEALIGARAFLESDAPVEIWSLNDKAITAIKEALMSVSDGAQPAVAEQHKQEPVNEGWKLVPIKPTEDMWKAVNKLDDEMAAGNYDGKGCSIEQAWNCLLDAAPSPPQPKEPEQEPVGINGLTESETNATASVIGLVNTTPPQRKPSRDEFEAWCCKRWAGDRGALFIRQDGEYDNGHVQFAWAAWQAAHGIKGDA